jgi:protein O-GlcNAc transferase
LNNPVNPTRTWNAAASLELAKQHHLAGDLLAARRVYEQLLEIDPKQAKAAFGIGLLELQTGQHQEAVAWMRQAIAIDPQEPHFHFGLAHVLEELKQYAEAEAVYKHVLAIDSQRADVHFAMGRLREARRNWIGAIAAYQAALELQPDFPEALNNLGNCHQRLGQFTQSEAAYRRALAQRPNYADALANLAIVLAALGQTDEAVDRLSAAIRVEPAVAMHHVNLGAVLCQRRAFADAVTILQKAIDLDSHLAEAAYNLGNALCGLGRLREAAGYYRRAVELKPDYADAHNNLGTVYKEQGEFSLAAAAFEAAMRACPSSAVAFNNAANVHRILHKMDEAEALLRQALEIEPGLSMTYNNLGNVLKDMGALDEAIDCYRKALAMEPGNTIAHSNLAYSLYFRATDGDEVLEECRRWDVRHGLPLHRTIQIAAENRSTHRRLRVGYVSGDFREHCQSLFTIPLLSNHNHEIIEVYCYSSVQRPDKRTREIEGYADVWRDVRHLDDAELSALIQNDEIDILVDLAMHMAGGRPGLFARKPAPVQVAWLAYPGTTGISAIDYVLTDPCLSPPGSDSHYSERVIRLPETFWCYDPLTEEPAVNELPALSRGHITFGCLNAPCKLSDHTMQLWAGVMEKIDNSRLLLMAPEGQRRRQLLDRLSAHGIASERVTMQPFIPRSMYLRTYHEIDLGLDTVPYNGHTTSLDSFWMGVPVVSRVGQTAVGRAGLSQLSNLGMSELAAKTDEQYIEIAAELASDLPRLATLRRELRDRMQRSALMDGERFARNIEAAYSQMWQAKQQI